MAASLGESKHEVGSTVYVPYEGGTHYQARVVKKEIREVNVYGEKTQMWHYFVHYMGWNKKYDEWVEETGCAVQNPDQLVVPNKTKPKNTTNVTHAKYDLAKPQITIAIPGALKQQLVQDHDCIKGNSKLVPMPRTPCILDILDRYTQKMRMQSQTQALDAEEQISHGLRHYFDRTLALLLLYNEEKAQADELLKNGDAPSSIYGAEHLLRLFLKLPELLPLEGSTEEQYRLLQAKLHEVLAFIEENVSEFFVKSESYITAKAVTQK